MKIMKRILPTVLLSICLSLVLCLSLASCAGGDNNDNGGGGGGGSSKVDYSVTVYDCNDNPISGAIVKVFQGSNMLSMYTTNTEGISTFNLDAGDYTVEVDYIGGYAFDYDKSACTLTAEKKAISVKLYKSVGEANMELSFAGEGDADAPLITDGEYMIDYSADSLTYFVFYPSVRGRYLISVDGDATAEVGNYGGPSYVLGNSIVDEKDAAEHGFYIDVRAYHLASTDREASKYVIGVKGNAGKGVLKIHCVADLPQDMYEAPWNNHKLDRDPALYTLPENTTLVDLDITDPALTVVYNSADGYYHLGTADGPVVLVRLTLPVTNLVEFPGFAELCDRTGFNCYIFDDDGNFVSKENYHDMMLQYIAAADTENGGDGVYPLTENLAEAIKLYGEHNGWWKKGADNYFFGDNAALIADGRGWLFACCYAVAE